MKNRLYILAIITTLALSLMACQSSEESTESDTNIEVTSSLSDATPSLDVDSSSSEVDDLSSPSDAASTGSSLYSSCGITEDRYIGNVGISAILSTDTDIAITY